MREDVFSILKIVWRIKVKSPSQNVDFDPTLTSCEIIAKKVRKYCESYIFRNKRERGQLVLL